MSKTETEARGEGEERGAGFLAPLAATLGRGGQSERSQAALKPTRPRLIQGHKPPFCRARPKAQQLLRARIRDPETWTAHGPAFSDRAARDGAIPSLALIQTQEEKVLLQTSQHHFRQTSNSVRWTEQQTGIGRCGGSCSQCQAQKHSKSHRPLSVSLSELLRFCGGGEAASKLMGIGCRSRRTLSRLLLAPRHPRDDSTPQRLLLSILHRSTESLDSLTALGSGHRKAQSANPAAPRPRSLQQVPPAHARFQRQLQDPLPLIGGFHEIFQCLRREQHQPFPSAEGSRTSKWLTRSSFLRLSLKACRSAL